MAKHHFCKLLNDKDAIFCKHYFQAVCSAETGDFTGGYKLLEIAKNFHGRLLIKCASLRVQGVGKAKSVCLYAPVGPLYVCESDEMCRFWSRTNVNFGLLENGSQHHLLLVFSKLDIFLVLLQCYDLYVLNDRGFLFSGCAVRGLKYQTYCLSDFDDRNLTFSVECYLKVKWKFLKVYFYA